MKAWEYARHLLTETKPVIRTEEEQTWDASGLMAGEDFKLKLFWHSNVPGSAAPECLMAGALQSLDNKGMALPPYEALLQAGLDAVKADDMEALYVADMTLRALMRQARPDPAHPSQATRRFANWPGFADAADWPAEPPLALTEADVADRLRGGWLAQLVGAAAGTALEGYTLDNIAEAFGPITGYVRPPNTYNDDITFEIAFLEACAEAGPQVTGADIAAKWTALIPMAWSAEAVALDAIRRGVLPPESGQADNPFDEWIGAQMRGTICGMIVPGRTREAARLAWIDAEVSHTGNGILGEVFNAVLAARAFTQPDTAALLEEAIALIPGDTEYGAALRFARDACAETGDWREAWRRCDAHYAEYNWIHVLPNAAAQVVALICGAGDFDRTLEIVCGIGHDVDCNAAQILCVLALQKGSGIVAERWSAPLLTGPIVTYMRRPAEIPFDDLIALTERAAARMRDGG